MTPVFHPSLYPALRHAVPTHSDSALLDLATRLALVTEILETQHNSVTGGGLKEHLHSWTCSPSSSLFSHPSEKAPEPAVWRMRVHNNHPSQAQLKPGKGPLTPRLVSKFRSVKPQSTTPRAHAINRHIVVYHGGFVVVCYTELLCQ